MKKRLTKFVSMFLLIAILASNFSMTADAAISNNVHDILFDWQYYYNSNSDVARAFGKNQTALRNHYEQYGKREGRAPSVLFNPKYYLQIQTDVRNAFGNDYVAAYNHFVNHGINEGRQASAGFHVSIYKANYADLRNAFGNNNLLYLKHYREFGINEKRNATTKITSGTSGNTSTSTSNTTGGQLIADGYYTIQKGKYGLNVQYAPTSGIGNMVLDTVNGEKNEIFYFQYVKAHNAYYITPYYRPDVALNALYGASCQSGSQLKAHPSNTSDTASLWYITRDENNLYHFQNAACKMYITLNGNVATGTALVMKKKQTTNQEFAINKVSNITNNQPSKPAGTTTDTWQAPMKNYVTTQAFGKSGHLGIDIQNKSDPRVYAAASGTVVHTGLNGTGTDASVTKEKKGNGYYIVIEHNINGKIVYSMYGHLQAGSFKVGVGQQVTVGQEIATMGNTGNSTGPHLHFAIASVKKAGSYYGYTADRATFTANSKVESRTGVTFYSPNYVINNNMLP